MTVDHEHNKRPAMLMQPMSKTNFKSFIEQSVAGYARDLERTYQYDAARAFEHAASSADELLPQRLDTDGHHFFNLCTDKGEIVGALWLEVQSHADEPATLFICDLEIRSTFQRQGWGRHALIEVEKWAIARGIYRVELNVFADNQAALALYRTQAFVPCEITMGKNLG